MRKSIWQLTKSDLGKYRDVTDGPNTWSGIVTDFFEEKGFALKDDGTVTMSRERHVYVNYQRHYSHIKEVKMEKLK